jgi:hypothetical protein
MSNRTNDNPVKNSRNLYKNMIRKSEDIEYKSIFAEKNRNVEDVNFEVVFSGKNRNLADVEKYYQNYFKLSDFLPNLFIVIKYILKNENKDVKRLSNRDYFNTLKVIIAFNDYVRGRISKEEVINDTHQILNLGRHSSTFDILFSPSLINDEIYNSKHIDTEKNDIVLTEDEYHRLKLVTGWNDETASENLSAFLIGIGTPTYTKEAIVEGVKKAGIYSKLSEGLTSLNTMRGGLKGNKGFVAEHLHAASLSEKGMAATVINDNGIADVVRVGKNGHKYYEQIKFGYKPGQIDYSRYKGQTIVVNNDNPYFNTIRSEAKKHGVKVVRSEVSESTASTVSKAGQIETSITGAKSAQVVPRVCVGGKVVAQAHRAGIAGAKDGAAFGAGFSIATNAIDVLTGEKNLSDAAGDVVVDTATSTAIEYGLRAAGSLAGTAGSALAGTAAGAQAVTAAGTVGSAIAGTTVGGAALGVGGAAIGGVAAAGTAVATVGTAAATVATGAVGAVGTAAASTAIGGAIAGSAVGGAAIAGATAVGAVAVAAAPVVAVGAVLGCGYSLCKRIFSW